MHRHAVCKDFKQLFDVATGGVGGEGRFGGGSGTDARATTPGGVSGPINDVEPNVRLSGGCGGGVGLNKGGGDGGGGGAIELGVLGTITLTGSTINASGGNGGDAGGEFGLDAGSDMGVAPAAAAAALLLHAVTVTLGGTINARGGNGGQGRGYGGAGAVGPSRT